MTIEVENVAGLQVAIHVNGEQLGHSLDVNLNIYTETALSARKGAVNTLESALRVM